MHATRVARVLRKRFEGHTRTVRSIVERMSDEELVAEYHEHRKANSTHKDRRYQREDTRRLEDFEEVA
jgi:hypothetical protein